MIRPMPSRSLGQSSACFRTGSPKARSRTSSTYCRPSCASFGHEVSSRHQAPFRDRSDAGRQLAAQLARYAGRPDVVVLALPRGGVPVGYEVARELGAPLDVFLVRKLGVPGHEELAMGAVAT